MSVRKLVAFIQSFACSSSKGKNEDGQQGMAKRENGNESELKIS